jgi:2-dehydropantoate 2-reductase
MALSVAVLGPGGVGGLIAAALARAGGDVTVIARESTVEVIERDGIHVESVNLGAFVAHPAATTLLDRDVDALIIATKAVGLEQAIERIRRRPPLVLPLLNGLDHLALLREHFAPETVLAGAIRVESDRPAPGTVVHTSPFLRVDMAGSPALQEKMEQLAAQLSAAGIPARVVATEAQVMWAKLVRLNALACTTSAWDVELGVIREDPARRAILEAAIREGAAVARAEGADIPDEQAMRELDAAHATLGSSMQRDIAAGREPELDAIPGAVLRAAARHGLECPTIEGLVAETRARIAAG